MLISLDTPHQIHKKYQAYLLLSEYEQMVLRLLAVVYRPIGITKLNTLIAEVGKADCFLNREKLKGLKPEQRTQLIAQGFISQDQKGILLNPLLVNCLSFDCVKEDSYQSLVYCIEQVLPLRTNDPWGNNNHTELYFLRDAYFTGKNIEPLLIDKIISEENLNENWDCRWYSP